MNRWWKWCPFKKMWIEWRSAQAMERRRVRRNHCQCSHIGFVAGSTQALQSFALFLHYLHHGYDLITTTTIIVVIIILFSIDHFNIFTSEHQIYKYKSWWSISQIYFCRNGLSDLITRSAPVTLKHALLLWLCIFNIIPSSSIHHHHHHPHNRGHR